MTAVGRDYSDVPPNRGVWKGRADETITVTVKVEPIDRVPPDWSDWSDDPGPLVGGLLDPVPAQASSASSSTPRSATASNRGSSSRSSPRCVPSLHERMVIEGPDADVAERDRPVIGLEQDRPLGDFLVAARHGRSAILSATFSWITWPFKTTLSKRALPIFLPSASNRGRGRRRRASATRPGAGRRSRGAESLRRGR